MLNWYAMGVNAPSFIDTANDNARKARCGDYHTHASIRPSDVTRSGSIQGWRAAPFAVATFKG